MAGYEEDIMKAVSGWQFGSHLFMELRLRRVIPEAVTRDQRSTIVHSATSSFSDGCKRFGSATMRMRSSDAGSISVQEAVPFYPTCRRVCMSLGVRRVPDCQRSA